MGLGNRHSLLGPARDHVSRKFFVSFVCFVVNFNRIYMQTNAKL